MPRPTKNNPERGDARTRLLDAALNVIRRKGFTAATVDDLCREAQVTKGAYFHHFPSKEALGVAAAEHWTATTGKLFEHAPYHDHNDPLDRILAYIDFRRSLIEDDTIEFSCLAGTMAQETFVTYPAIRDACAASLFGHASTLEEDIARAMEARGIKQSDWSARSLANHTQTVLQGGFILAKAANDPGLARESIDHLRRYVEALLRRPSTGQAAAA